MTVGELVLERYALLSRGRSMGGVAGPQDVATMAISGWLRTLRSLGLWDAEVQEAIAEPFSWDKEKGLPAEVRIYIDPEAPDWLKEYADKHQDAPIRVVVLKGAEDDPA